MGTPIYLRDLKDSLKEQEEDTIRKERPDLIAALENGEDIKIGEYFYTDKYELA